MFGSSFYTPTIDSDSSSDDITDVAVLGGKDTEHARNRGIDMADNIVGHFEASFQSLIHSKSKRHEPSAMDKKMLRKKRHRVSFFVKKKTDNMDAILHMRIPILGSVSVKVRAELYHDLLDLQIKSSAGRHYSSSIYANTGDGDRGNSSDRHSTSADAVTDSTSMMLGLCRLLVALQEEKQYTSDTDGVRHTIRFHLLQYLLGLDERW
jgi:hypothetical protein